MSGVEIAGLILGGFPLIISTLEHYRDGFEPLQEWWKFESEFGNFIEELGTQQARFDMSLEKLLAPFVTSDAQMNTLLSERSPEAWHDPQLKKELRGRLGSSYDWYVAICRKMSTTLDSLEERLGIVDGQVKYIDDTKWDHEFRRLRISFSRKKFKHVKLLVKYNDELQQLLTSSDELAPLRRRRQKTPLITLMRSLRQHSQSLYSGLVDRWRCQCPISHEAKLLLERRMTHDNDLHLHLLFEASSVRKPIEIRIEKETSQGSERPLVSGTPLGSLFELKQQVHARSAELHAAAQNPSTSNNSVKTSSRSPINWNTPLFHKPKKQARFQAQPASATAQGQPVQSHLQIAEIKDICTELPKWGSKAGCLGFIPAAQNSRLLFYPDTLQSNLHENCKTITLEELLSAPTSPSSDMEEMNRQQRFILANILAFTVLQLQTTPWLSSTWNKRDVVFLYPSSPPGPLLSRPYISKVFPSTTPATAASATDCKQCLFRFGIVLLELTFNQRLETLPIREKYPGPNGVPNEYTDLCTAKEWHHKVEGECGEGLAEVIRRCIDCSFGPKPDWNSEEFAEAYYRNVVEPLRELLRQWEGGV